MWMGDHRVKLFLDDNHKGSLFLRRFVFYNCSLHMSLLVSYDTMSLSIMTSLAPVDTEIPNDSFIVELLISIDELCVE